MTDQEDRVQALVIQDTDEEDFPTPVDHMEELLPYQIKAKIDNDEKVPFEVLDVYFRLVERNSKEG